MYTQRNFSTTNRVCRKRNIKKKQRGKGKNEEIGTTEQAVATPPLPAAQVLFTFPVHTPPRQLRDVMHKKWDWPQSVLMSDLPTTVAFLMFEILYLLTG